ncbi:uncharacterized protein F4812DRAFT_437357 [Daldinia caldariorum]|uniref:uncharacterized protein n=1 Tax=Daldinia caldariorum TaxID=326644 RepID=UPI0020086E51|nr:uncharacterized protein F4812DRAFT_437357 [Daldinia caldariorum]KAI1465738.1 hypothetical protein F4812DRAFT_437357 [Daldinia caldariorum]
MLSFEGRERGSASAFFFFLFFFPSFLFGERCFCFTAFIYLVIGEGSIIAPPLSLRCFFRYW